MEPETRTCKGCYQSKPVTEFTVNRAIKGGLDRKCRDCNREACRRYYQANLEREKQRKRDHMRQWRQENLAEARRRDQARASEQRAAARERHRRYKGEVLAHYGRECACCGSTHRLSIDHIAGDGGSHRIEIGAQSAIDFYRWLIQHGFPSGFQTLCMRCNSSKSRSESCRLVHSGELVKEEVSR